ncbi:hypothetical protein PROFUN_07011 [Planoprotostelium fungivorum]|uniref:Uncharacterized protein n=1 Tax=Planoprotostelium fungivorum TaxID=1890364 RepID=A0A2P6NMR4_9EUKA|nr:hypothetical protein PROFUN_07011 [Planoprotostelium fungivorum]
MIQRRHARKRRESTLVASVEHFACRRQAPQVWWNSEDMRESRQLQDANQHCYQQQHERMGRGVEVRGGRPNKAGR